MARLSSDAWVTAERAATIAALDRAAEREALLEERALRRVGDDPGSYRLVGKDPWQ